MAAPELRAIIELKAAKYGLDPDFVEAEIQQESYPMWDQNSKRYEAAFYQHYIVPMKITDPVEATGRATSFGLLQVMGEVAREMGYQGAFEGLFDPMTCLEWGCKKLAKCVKRYPGDLDSAIASYNAGTAVKNADGTFRNQNYVDGVNGYLKKIKSGA